MVVVVVFKEEKTYFNGSIVGVWWLCDGHSILYFPRNAFSSEDDIEEDTTNCDDHHVMPRTKAEKVCFCD